MDRDARIPEHGDPNKPRHELLQKLQAFRDDRFIEIAQPRQFPPGRDRLATRPSPTGSVATMTMGWSGSLLGRQRCRADGRHQDIHFETNKLGHQLGYPLHAPLGPADFQCDRLPFHVAQFSSLCRNAPKVCSVAAGLPPAMKPTRRIFGGVCAPTASGQAAEAAVALPKSAMKSRRRILDPNPRRTHVSR